MDNDVVISAKNITKTYPLYNSHVDRVKETFHPFRKKYHRPFTALNNISFEVKKGEVLGVIGRNGSGKSTLLQILCGILRPTSGTVAVNGRISLLLELGAGFNPEFTGRQNVYLNGAIIGLPPEGIEARFDEIADFAGIGEFIDQPVKTYSSGMFLRLAFAVQVLLDPEILVIDEVLAVGDIFFQQKCFVRMNKLIDDGVAVVLVTHDLDVANRVCQRVLVLNRGHVHFLGRPDEATKRYQLLAQEGRVGLNHGVPPRETNSESSPGFHKTLAGDRSLSWPDSSSLLDISKAVQISNGWARCTQFALCDEEGKPCTVFQQGQIASFFYEVELLRDIDVPSGGLAICDRTGAIFHGKHSIQHGFKVPHFVKSGTRIRFRHDIKLNLAYGEYTIDFGVISIRADRLFPNGMSIYDFEDNHKKILQVSNIGSFIVGPRDELKPLQILFFGLVELPSKCTMTYSL